MKSEVPFITRISAQENTDASHGNGLGIVDFTTERAFRKFSCEETYPNSLTSTVPVSVKIPMVLKWEAAPTNRVWKNKHQAVSQGVRRFGKRSLFRNR